MLGLFSKNPAAIQGSVLQMINHGLSTGALFLLVGMIYERRHSRMIVDFGGLAKRMPIFATIFMVVTLSSIGLPGLNGFVGEYMILLGSFVQGAFSKIYVVIATAGVILAAVYMLWMFQRVMFGTLDKTNEALPDLNAREIVVMLPILLFIVWIGVYPKPFLSKIEKSVGLVVTQVQTESAIGHAGEQENRIVPQAHTRLASQSVVSNQQNGDTLLKSLLPDSRQPMADSQYTELALQGTQRVQHEKIEKEAETK